MVIVCYRQIPAAVVKAIHGVPYGFCLEIFSYREGFVLSSGCIRTDRDGSIQIGPLLPLHERFLCTEESVENITITKPDSWARGTQRHFFRFAVTSNYVLSVFYLELETEDRSLVAIHALDEGFRFVELPYAFLAFSKCFLHHLPFHFCTFTHTVLLPVAYQ
jgi:hypothetical protein